LSAATGTDSPAARGGATATDLSTTAVIIPALNEAENLAVLLPQLSRMGLAQIIVGDNGSTDGTADTARRLGAVVATADRQGYGAACQAALGVLDRATDTVVFLDADLADDLTLLVPLVQPIQRGDKDMVLTARVKRRRQDGSMTLPQAFGTWLAVRLVRLGWGYRYRDLGPFRAIRRDSLDKIAMRDRAFGWTVEMQIRAVEHNLRISEIDAPYFRRSGQSKISGTIRGVFLAGYWILRTCAVLYLTRRRRLAGRKQSRAITAR